jgi:hypothetical protein
MFAAKRGRRRQPPPPPPLLLLLLLLLPSRVLFGRSNFQRRLHIRWRMLEKQISG